MLLESTDKCQLAAQTGRDTWLGAIAKAGGELAPRARCLPCLSPWIHDFTRLSMSLFHLHFDIRGLKVLDLDLDLRTRSSSASRSSRA